MIMIFQTFILNVAPAVFFFILGLVAGSFFNVVIFRINTARSFGGRSACMSCRHKLNWSELIPLFSFLRLKGRCRHCRTKISLQYPLIELAAGLVFSVLFLKFQDILFISMPMFIFVYVYYAAMFSLLMIIVAYDLRHKIIPDSLSFIFGALALAGLFFFHPNNLLSSSNFFVFYWYFPTPLELLSGLLISLPFYLLWRMSRGAWMGLGDAKLALGLGYFLGFPLALSAVVTAFWIGAIAGLSLIIFKKGYGLKSEIPFAPYLVLAAFLTFIFNWHFFGI